MKSVFLRKVLSMIIVTILCSFILTAGIYTVTIRQAFAVVKSEDLIERSNVVVYTYILYARGEISKALFEDYVSKSFSNWDVIVCVYNANGVLLTPNTQREVIEAMDPYVNQVLKGEVIALVPQLSLYSEGSVMVGVPAMADKVYGAVFLVQPLTELNPAINSMTLTLVSSMLIVTGFMGIFALFVSQRFARPINRMRDIATHMAEGDFNIRADEQSRDEIGQLGRSLNFLSSQLSATINELILERNRLRSVLDGLNEGIIALDAQGRITHVNPALERIFDFQEKDHADDEEVLCSTIIDDISLCRDLAICVEKSIPAVRSYRRGSAVYRITISPLTTGQGGETAAGAVALFYDVTQSELLEQTRREYVANVSHELRTPISAVRGLAEALNDGLITDESRRMQYYSHILRESLRMSRLIDDLLELSRLQSGSTSVELSRVPLASELADVTDRYQIRADDLGVQLQLDAQAKNAPDVLSNADRIEQVLIILLDNALKFSPVDSSIQVKADWDESTVRISVRDHGAGIAAEDIDYIFDRFYKADKAHSGNGTGLGLAIAKEALQRMNESISVINHPEGGAEFTFTLKRYNSEI